MRETVSSSSCFSISTFWRCEARSFAVREISFCPNLRINRYKSSYMLETLVNVDILVYNLVTSNNCQPETISRKD